MHHVIIPTENIDFSDPLWPLEPNGSLIPKKALPHLEAWCRENLSGAHEVGWTTVQGRFYGFIAHIENATDAVLFKLRWNGIDDWAKNRVPLDLE